MIKHYLQCDTCCCQWHRDEAESVHDLLQSAADWGWYFENSLAYCPACKEQPKPMIWAEAVDETYRIASINEIGVESAQHTTAASGTQAPCGGLSDLKGEFTTESGVTFKTKEN